MTTERQPQVRKLIGFEKDNQKTSNLKEDAWH
jgi:hypothetical protein